MSIRHEDYGTVILSADSRFLDTAQCLLAEVPQAQRQPLVICDARDASTSIRGHSDDAGFMPWLAPVS